jgi:hypothetical protein
MLNRNFRNIIKQLASLNLVLLMYLALSNKCTGQNIISLQISPQLSAQSEKWDPVLKSKNGDVNLVVFGPWFTTNINKLDSGTFKNKSISDKESYYDSEEGINGYKTKKVELSTFYRINIFGKSDSAESIYSVFTSSSKRKQTVLGILLSKKELIGNTTVLSYSKQLAGNIRLMNDSDKCSFFLDYAGVGGSIPTGFLLKGTDSIVVSTLYALVTKPTNDPQNPEQVIRIIPRGISLFDINEVQIAALVFKDPKDYKAKETENFSKLASVIISNEINKSNQMAIASLFAIIMAIEEKDLYFNHSIN